MRGFRRKDGTPYPRAAGIEFFKRPGAANFPAAEGARFLRRRRTFIDPQAREHRDLIESIATVNTIVVAASIPITLIESGFINTPPAAKTGHQHNIAD